jgi:hypothetical protein
MDALPEQGYTTAEESQEANAVERILGKELSMDQGLRKLLSLPE